LTELDMSFCTSDVVGREGRVCASWAPRQARPGPAHLTRGAHPDEPSPTGEPVPPMVCAVSSADLVGWTNTGIGSDMHTDKFALCSVPKTFTRPGGPSTRSTRVRLAGRVADHSAMQFGREGVDGSSQLSVRLEFELLLGEVMVGFGLLKRALTVLSDHHERRQEDCLERHDQRVGIRTAWSRRRL
jgi:hypothetical protein